MKNSSNKAPSALSAEARRWWTQLVAEYGINDPGGRLLLSTALEAFDRLRQAQKLIKKDGPVVFDRFQQPKPHPLLTVERDARAQMMSALRGLNLDIEPLRDGPGRPGRS